MAEVLLLDHTDCTTGDHQTVDMTIQYNHHHPADENPMRLAERTKHRRQNGNFFLTRNLRITLFKFRTKED